MAPGLNSLPPSPYSPRQQSSVASRRHQDTMVPPSVPMSPPSQSPSLGARELSTTTMPAGDNTGVGLGPGPLRHPRPLTAADLHMQLEKEQEAVVNRLTRELSLLRQQTQSVASTTSSASAGLPENADHSTNHLISGPSHPTPSRRHRSSSNLSTRSAITAATTATGVTGTSGNTVGTTAGIAGSTNFGVAPARDTTAPYSLARDSLSRHSSVASRRSEASSPSLSSSHHQGEYVTNMYGHRHTSSATQQQSSTPSQQHTAPGGNRLSYVPSTQRHDEVTHQRSELEIVKRENESLRRRIRDLERTLSIRRDSANDLSRRASISTNASVPTQGLQPTGDDGEDAVNVGESAGSVGFGAGQ